MSKANQQGAGSWAAALRIYSRPQVLAMLFLGFAAGLPLLLVFSTLTAWLRDFDISKTAIGFFAWVGITYSIKFVWAPVIDRLPIPGITTAFGKRRGWMLLAQFGIALGLAAMAYMGPEANLAFFALLAVGVAFASATQDIAIDAYRVEAVIEEWQGAMAAMYVFGYRLALLVAGAGALYLAEYQSWEAAYVVMALLMAIGLITVLLIQEPDHQVSADTWAREQRVIDFLAKNNGAASRLQRLQAWFIGAVICPFADFFERNGLRMAVIILLFVAVYRISDITMGIMANPFYLDLGYSKADIASIGKVFGFIMTIIGAALGGLLVVRYGIMRPLLAGAIMVAATNLLFAWMAHTDPYSVSFLQHLAVPISWVMNLFGSSEAFTPPQAMLALVISADNLSGGLAVSAFIAYLSSLVNRTYTATQYALFSSLMTLPAKFLSGFSGWVVDSTNFTTFFLIASALGLPAILLVIYLIRQPSLQPSNADGNSKEAEISQGNS